MMIKEITGVPVDLCKHYDSDTDKCTIGCASERVRVNGTCPYNLLTRRDPSECACYKSVRENAKSITLSKDLKLPGTDTLLERGDVIEIINEYYSPEDMLADQLHFRIWGRTLPKPVRTRPSILDAVETLGDMFSPMELGQMASGGCTCEIVLEGEIIDSFDFRPILDYLSRY